MQTAKPYSAAPARNGVLINNNLASLCRQGQVPGSSGGGPTVTATVTVSGAVARSCLPRPRGLRERRRPSLAVCWIVNKLFIVAATPPAKLVHEPTDHGRPSAGLGPASILRIVFVVVFCQAPLRELKITETRFLLLPAPEAPARTQREGGRLQYREDFMRFPCAQGEVPIPKVRLRAASPYPDFLQHPR